MQKKESEENKISMPRLVGLSSASVVLGVWGAAQLGSWSSAEMFPFVVSWLGCFAIKLFIDKDMQEAIKGKALAIIKKGKLP